MDGQAVPLLRQLIHFGNRIMFCVSKVTDIVFFDTQNIIDLIVRYEMDGSRGREY